MTNSHAFSELQIQYRPLEALRVSARNPRTHSPTQLRQIADSIRHFGFTNPILIDDEDQVLAGHGRLAAARTLGLEQVPTIRLAQMTDADKRAYVIADNRIAENAGWDEELLALELRYLTDLDLDFDVTITGFQMPEIDLLIQGLDEADPADVIPERDPEAPVITQVGDLYELGAHRLLCEDATKTQSYAALLGDERAQVVFTDPPYNVPISGHVSGLGATDHREFPMACGEMTPSEFTDFLRTVFTQLLAHSQDGAIHYVCIDWRHVGEMLAAGTGTFTELKNICTWVKHSGGMGSLYRSQHEFVLVFKSGTAAHINNVELGKHGRYRTNVWHYAGANGFGADRNEALSLHPTTKPVALIADALLDCSRRKGLVLDPFGGAGSTLIAAEKTGRRARLMELDPGYVDVTIRRWAQLTGKTARHVASGLTFADLSAHRLAPASPGSPPAIQDAEVRHG